MAEPTEAEHLKHLDHVQAVIARLSGNSFSFKGYSITLAAALGGFAAYHRRTGLLAIALLTTVLFWGLDGYYLWLERGFVDLHRRIAADKPETYGFSMEIDRNRAFRRWLKTCLRFHLLFFYGVVIVADIIGILLIMKGAK